MLATLAELSAALGLTDNSQDALATSSLTQANGLIAGYIGADLSDATTDRHYTVTLREDASYLNLPVFPLISVSSITNNGVALALTTDYLLDLRLGSVDFVNGLCSSGRTGNRVVVVYRAGFAAVPADLNAVCLNIAAAIFNNGGSFATAMNGGRGELKSMTMFDAMSMSFETGVGESADSAGTPEGMIRMWMFVLKPYRCIQPVLR
jgi:hypothetical protein